ncbi:NAD-dependent succinate-semialdehyde dehydrogenase [Blastomonas sp. UPD001]|jgi:succinate-semialdehyde dehydrogenase / glutarate-semialdehyde dehydrogenase|uniref:NAD-dependent succinate-semialdehyde dehydrogenase n=1 Tax=Blastomonas sp. UPD001 TaxID=2217673 RepID=UPI000C5D3E0F|nr:NAD-dependent succinate-semialdehyde dehydrogenase [Blastomonas sp. UPD001]MAF63236.1 NAD-dependent succinate-semialdehyde dehydrogenase [Blastomonas sp.]|tara:strand:- start:7125 stop:8561 length:1437 start_codon:yes stop_codon:yes gene_type:complete
MTAYEAQLGLYIAGEWRSGEGRDTHNVLNPATGATLAPLPLATSDDLDLALEATARGFSLWRDTAPEQRAAILTKTAALLRERTDRIATIATLEQGKPVAEAKGEIGLAAGILEFHAGEAQRIYGRVLQRPKGTRSMVLQQPVGPVAAFCAWNFPALNVVRKLAPALAAGCSVIIKPSEETSGCAIEVMRCFQDAGLPGDVAQMVFGVPDQISRHLLASPVTRKLSFTGSVPVGKHLMRLAADTMMRTTMELGGHGPVLVFDDCNLEQTLDTLVANKFRNAGQVCIAPTRFYVQQDIYERFAQGFAERAQRIAVGNGLDPATQMGPMANPRRPAAINDLVQDARNAGARVLTGGQPIESGSGFFVAPTVLVDVPLSARAMNEEPFGPLALLTPFATPDEAIEQANRLPYGLAAYCFTENGRLQNRLGDDIEAGMIAVNNVRLSWPDSPFGGMKDSGYGSEDGPEGIAAHLVTKTFHMM